MRFGPVGQHARIDGRQRVGLGVGVDGVRVLAQHLPGVGQAQPAGAILRVLLRCAQPGPRPCERIACWRCSGVSCGHRLLLLAAGLAWSIAVAGFAVRRIDAGRLGDARHLGAQHRQRYGASGGLLASRSCQRAIAARAVTGSAPRAGRDSRAMRASSGCSVQRAGCSASSGGQGDGAVGFERQGPRPARPARRRRSGSARATRARLRDQLRDVHRLRRCRRAGGLRRDRRARPADRDGRSADRGPAPATGSQERERGRQPVRCKVSDDAVGRLRRRRRRPSMRRSISSRAAAASALGQRAGGALALQLGELVAIDRELALDSRSRGSRRARSSGQSRAPTVAVVSRASRNSSISAQPFRSASRRRAFLLARAASGGTMGCAAARGDAAGRRRRSAARSGAPSHRTSVPALKGGFSST